MSSGSEISVQCGDSLYRGRCRVADGAVHVASAYGSASAALDPTHNLPEMLGQLILYGLAQAWTRRERARDVARSA